MKKRKTSNIQLSLFSDADFEVESTYSDCVSKSAPMANFESNRTNSSISSEGRNLVKIQKEAHTTPHVLILDDAGKEKTSDLFLRLARSKFRSSFHLKQKDREYIDKKGLDVIKQHAADFVSKRLAPAYIPNDGQQTPMRGHPVFLAQHATGCCCRGCFHKWHHIPEGRALTSTEQAYAVEVLMTWIRKEYFGSTKL